MKTTEVLKTFKNIFEESKFEEAKEYLIKYEDAFEKNVFSYNRGVVDFNLSNFSYAKLHLERAVKNGFDSKEARKLLTDIDQNLSITRAQEAVTIQDNLIEKTEFLSIDIALIFSLVLLVGGTLSLKKIYGTSLKIACLFVTAIPLVWTLYYMTNFTSYIALEERELREGPSKLFEDTFTMPAGIKYVISKRYKNWGYVTYPEKYSGWLKLKLKEQI